jgi:glyoxylase-like metal-dependent hydrolase (beta-lactamase superfamily II)
MKETKTVIPLALGMAKAFLVKGTQPVLIDTGLPKTKAKLLTALAEQDVKPEDLRLIIITHGHTDHFGGLDVVRTTPGAKVAIHRLDADSLRTGRSIPLVAHGFRGALLKLMIPASRKPQIVGLEPNIILDDEFDLAPFGVSGKVIATPGHTAGSVSAMLESGEAVVGDLMGGMMSGNKPTIAFWAWSREKWVESIRKVLSFNPRIVHVTHGGPFDPARIRSTFGL